MKNNLSRSFALLLVSTLHFSPNFASEIHYNQPVLLTHTKAISPRLTNHSGLLSVDEGTVALLEYCGGFHKMAKPGFHYQAPFLSTFIRVDLKTVLVDTPSQEALTKDMQKLVIDGSFSYRILDAYKAVYHVQNLENNLTFLFYQSVLSHLAQLTNTEAMNLDKNKFSDYIKHTINCQLSGIRDSYGENDPTGKDKDDQGLVELETQNNGVCVKDRDWGVAVTQVAITNIAYPVAVIKSMNDQREAELRARVVERDAETAKQKTSIDAEANKQKILLAAEADKQKTLLDADANKQRILVTAEADKQKMNLAAEGAKQKAMLEAEANLFSMTKEAEARAKKLEIETKIKLETAKADADAKIMIAEGEAQAIRLKARAEADAKEMLGEVYAKNPALMQREMMSDIVEGMMKFYTSSNSKVIISDGGDKGGNNNFMTQLLTMQAMFNGNNPGIGGIVNPHMNMLQVGDR